MTYHRNRKRRVMAATTNHGYILDGFMLFEYLVIVMIPVFCLCLSNDSEEASF